MTTVERVELGSHAKTAPATGDGPNATPAPPILRHELRALSEITDRLAARFPELPRAWVTEFVCEAHQRFDHSSIRDFVPLLVEREAYRALAHAGPRR